MSWASDRISRAADKSRFMQFVQTVSSRALGLAVATALMLLVFVAANTFVGKRLERSILLVDTIDDFEAALGFGGMIHAFKNAVLRPDETDYLERARIEAARAAELVDALTIQVARLPEPVALTETRAMVALYASNLDRVEEMNAAGIDTRAIDRAVRVDDTPALREREALRRIAEANLAFWRRALDLLLFAEIATFSVVAGGAVIAVARQRHIAAAQNATRWALERETEVNADLQAFAYAASHDLKSPLSTAVMLLDEVVRSDAEDALSEDQSQLLGHAARTLKRAQRQVADIMTLASVLRGDPSVAATVDPTDLNAVFENVRDDLHGELAAAGAVLEVGPLPHLRGYSAQIRALCQNLVSNAVKYRKADVPPVVNVSGERDPAQGVFRLSVSDSGIGVAPEHQARIFEAFKRLHRHDEIEGTGLGLSIRSRIVRNLNGTLSIASTLGEGSTFTVTVPLDLVSDNRAEAA